jgi:tellurite resistance protein TerC
MKLFHLLHYGLAAILSFVGVKMLIEDFFHVPVGVSLIVISSILVISVIASIIWPDTKYEDVPHITTKE